MYVWLWSVVACLLVPAARASAGEFVVPLMDRPPSLDGRVAPEEWSRAAGFDGFAWEGALERRRVRAFVGATEARLYLAMVSQMPTEGRLLAEVKPDTLKTVFDDSVEVWVDPTPGAQRGRTFQMVANSLGRQGYKLHARGGEPEDPSWEGRWRMANGLHEGWWHCEMAVPLAQLAPGRRADEGAWGINLCRNWKQPWAFSSLGGMAYAPEDLRFRFTRDPAPGVAHEHRQDPATGLLRSALLLTNPSASPLTLRAEVLLTRDRMPEVRQRESVRLAPGARRVVPLALEDHATRRFILALRVLSEDGRTAYYDRSYRWDAGPPWQWRTAQARPLPVDFQFAYYPYRNRMRILADVTGLPASARLRGLTAEVRRRGSRRPVKVVRLDRLRNGRQELSFSLPPLQGRYEVAVRATGRNVPAGEVVKPFERTRYPWEHNRLGRSRKVYPPFTPLRVAGTRVFSVLREHALNGLGLWDQVTPVGKPLLAAPMRFRALRGGRDLRLAPAPLRFTQRDPDRVVARGGFRAPGLTAAVRSTWDYDGVMRVDLTLAPEAAGSSSPGPARASAAGRARRSAPSAGSKATHLDALTLEVPLRNAAAPLLHAMGDGIRNTLYQRVPEGQGVVWTAAKVQANDLPRGFCSYLYLGSPVRGLSWFAENDRGWSWDRRTPNLDLVRSGGTLTLRVHLVNRPITLRAPRTLTFGLLAAPVKPRLSPWRHRWWRDRYSLLGTDINWLALGDCGSVYPAGKDMALWQAIRRGNRKRLSDAEVEAVVERGRRYFEPYGPEVVRTYEAHVRYNLRSRYGTRMVFYYNRSSYQAADEFQTFQDEWCETDFRSVGPGRSRGEIQIVPSESYIDHALYWYGRSFDVGGNQGVYWDNWFFGATYNTGMTGAYTGADGTITPSTGLWGLRELARRTFQYMNERGMLPITMPHMTSTGILPLLSFATVQYDWEWKYSEGDFQYRFPREYIQLVSNGELAGTWPVLLGDHGAQAEDPWTQRTFAGVCLVHEMTPSGGLESVWNPLLKPIFRLLDQRGLQVYRYWDERPQPVTSGDPDLPTIVYSLPGKEAVVVVTSYAEQDAEAALRIDGSRLGLAPGYRVLDAETGEALPVRDDTVSFPLKKHDVRELRVVPE